MLMIVIGWFGKPSASGSRPPSALTVTPHSEAAADPPADYLRSLYFDNLTHSAPALRYLVDLVGVDRVVLGSDYPADMGYTDPVGWLEAAPLLDDTEKGQILGENLEQLLGLTARERQEATR